MGPSLRLKNRKKQTGKDMARSSVSNKSNCKVYIPYRLIYSTHNEDDAPQIRKWQSRPHPEILKLKEKAIQMQCHKCMYI